MEEENDDDGGEGIETAGEESGAVIGDNDGVVCDPNDGENEHDHERSQSSEGGAELEDVPRHHRPRSVHHSKLIQSNSTNLGINRLKDLFFPIELALNSSF